MRSRAPDGHAARPPRVAFVSRESDLLDGSFVGAPSGDVSFCPEGTCPSGGDGTGLSGTPLAGPLGVYRAHGGSQYRVKDERLGIYGRLILLADPSVSLSPPEPIVGGVFRNSPYDPFGDAWYCVGDGSSLTELPSGAMKASLKNLTRLSPCAASSGTDTATVSVQPPPGYGLTVTSTLAEFSGNHLMLRGWWEGAAQLSFYDSDNARQTFIDLRTATPWPTGTRAAPLESATTDAEFFFAADGSNVVRGGCAGAGILSWAADDSVNLDLSAMGGLASCPGTPVPNDAIDLVYH